MDDIKYSYLQEIKDKKAAATGAFKKKGGAKSKKCTLPFETLRGKERKKYMESTTITKNLREIYDWKEYKQLPDDEKKICIEAKGHKYGWSSNAVGRSFGVAQNTANLEINRLGLAELFKQNGKGITYFQHIQLNEKASADHIAWKRIVSIVSDEPITTEDKPLENTVEDISENAMPEKDTDKNAEPEKVTIDGDTQIKNSDVVFTVLLNGGLTGKQLKHRLEGIAKALDKNAKYTVMIAIKEG